MAPLLGPGGNRRADEVGDRGRSDDKGTDECHVTSPEIKRVVVEGARLEEGAQGTSILEVVTAGECRRTIRNRVVHWSTTAACMARLPTAPTTPPRPCSMPTTTVRTSPAEQAETQEAEPLRNSGA